MQPIYTNQSVLVGHFDHAEVILESATNKFLMFEGCVGGLGAGGFGGAVAVVAMATVVLEVVVMVMEKLLLLSVAFLLLLAMVAEKCICNVLSILMDTVTRILLLAVVVMPGC